jgi:hypothetical protein
MEVRQYIEAADLMDRLYFPITADPTEAEHRSKFSYFLEFLKNSKLRKHVEISADLPERFARWVRDGQVNTGAKVRRLTKVLDHGEALKLLEVEGFDAAERFLTRAEPKEQELYATVEKARTRLQELTVTELVELASSPDRLMILQELHSQIELVIESAERFGRRGAGAKGKQSTVAHA